MPDWFNDLLSEHVTNTSWLVLNFAYLAYTASSLFKEMLRLRMALLIATVFYISYGFIEGIWSMVWWNIPVGLIHLWRIVDLLRQRRSVNLDDEADAIRVLLYQSLNPVEFDELWSLGEEQVLDDGHVVIEQGALVTRITMILDGNVRVESDGRPLSELGRFRFVGEMSNLSGKPASATVITDGAARIRSWDSDKLEELLRKNAPTERAHLRAVGRDLADKLA